jgi:hypothetical protein
MPRKSKSPAKSKSLVKTLKSLSPIPGSPGGLGGVSGPLSVQSSSKSNAQIVAIVFGSIGLIINVYALVWIMKLEAIPECKCSDTWMRLYIKYFLYIYIPVLIISMLLNIYLYSSGLFATDLTSGIFVAYRAFAGFVALFGFANMIIAILFISKLKEINCECSEDIKREIYFIYNIIMASFIALAILFVLMAAPIGFIMGANMKR